MTFQGRKLRMFSKQLERQGSIEEENFELMQINKKAEKFRETVRRHHRSIRYEY